MNREVEKLIELALADGKITKKERKVIIKKAAEYGIDEDEIELIIDAKLTLLKRENKAILSSKIKAFFNWFAKKHSYTNLLGMTYNYSGLSITIGIIGIIFGFYLVFFEFDNMLNQSFFKERNIAQDLSYELENKSEHIHYLITKGRSDSAMILLKELVHPSLEKTDFEKEKKGDYTIYYTYSEYWKVQREILRKKIEDNLSKSSSKYGKQTSSENLTSNKTNDLDVENKFLGLYVANRSDDKSQFFKFSKDSNGKLNILYQDNINAELNIIKFSINSFSVSTGEIVLTTEENKEINEKLFFRKDPNSENGYKLLSENGVEFIFVSK